MGSPISLFSGHAQRENRTTNYCLLVLRLLYEENPKYLAEVLSALVDERLLDLVGVRFEQQQRRAGSVPDGLVRQEGFTLYIETKNFDWFYDEQLERHLAALDEENPGFKVLVALSNFEGQDRDRFAAIEHLCEERYRDSIAFAAKTFEDFLNALRLENLPKNLSDAVLELRSYFDDEGLLPTWKGWLDVVNCAGLPADVLEAGVYMCPAAGGAYSHGRCRYFGMYREKRVEKIAEIEAVVDLNDRQSATLKWQNIEGDESDWVARARAAHQARRPNDYPTRVFVLGKLHDTDFQKDSSGGMMGSKQYFDVSHLGVKDAAELALSLRGVAWSSLHEEDAR